MIKTYINGFSAICAQGKGRDEIEKNLFNHPKLPEKIEFELDGEDYQLNYFPAFSTLRLSLSVLVNEIEKQILQTLLVSGWQESDLDNIPIFLASTSFTMAEYEIRFFDLPKTELKTFCYQQSFSLNEVSQQIKKRWPAVTIINVATSCTSASNALLYAQRYIQSGVINRAIIVGFESFNSVTLDGFHSLGLSTSQFVPPFSQYSDGLILGEGIGCVAISNQPNPNSSYRFTLAGGAMTCDTGNITTTDPEQVISLIESVLDTLQLTTAQITAIKAHATGSPTNDHVERQALLTCFANSIPILFFKPYIGHTLGACGVLECILLLISIEAKKLPLIPNYKLSEQCSHSLTDSHDINNSQFLLSDGYYLLDYLGFGGNNSVLLLGVNQS